MTTIQQHLTKARKYARQQFNWLMLDAQYKHSHPSFAAIKALELTEFKFFNLKLPNIVSHGVEGFTYQDNGKHGFTYINLGDSYATTIGYCSKSDKFLIICWADKAPK